MQWGRPWQSASKPQGSLANEHDKGIVRVLGVSQQYSSHNNDYSCTTNANCNVLPTSAGVKDHTLNATMTTIVTVNMANGSSTSSATMAVTATTSVTTRRVSPSARTRASSSATYTASTPITCTTSATLICNQVHKLLQQVQTTTTTTQPR